MFQSEVCKRCHEVLIMMSMNIYNIVNLNIYGVDYICIINIISNSGAVNLLENDNLSKKNGPS